MRSANTQAVGRIVSVTERFWDGYVKDGEQKPAGSTMEIQVSFDFNEKVELLWVPDKNGWRDAFRSVTFGHEAEFDLRTSARNEGGRARLALSIVDVKIGKPALASVAKGA